MVDTVYVVDDYDPVAFASFADAVDKAISDRRQTRVAFDCEGVNLSRNGSLEIVSIYFEDDSCGDDVVYLVDLGIKESDTLLREERICLVKRLLECESVLKVIHDCRMDCDALYYHCNGTRVHNVHDTSSFQSVLSGCENVNLNDTLEFHGLSPNQSRNKDVYKSNPAFWAQRPMTNQMIEWASKDVDKLLVLASRQASMLLDHRVTGGHHHYYLELARTKSRDNSTAVASMRLDTTLQCHVNVGHFIGKGGCNIKDLQKRAGALIYHRANDNRWLVFYRNERSLSMVRNAMMGC